MPSPRSSEGTTLSVPHPLRRGLLLILAAAIAWGTGGAIAAVLFRTGGLGPIAVSFWRQAIATATVATTTPRRPQRRRARAIATGVCLATSQAAYFGAVRECGLAVSTLLVLGGAALASTVGGRVLLGERLGRRTVGALLTALVGLALLLGAPVKPASGAGYALAALSALTYSAVTLLGRSAFGGGVSVTTFASGALCLLPFALASGGIRPSTRHLASTVVLLVVLGVVLTALAYRWYFTGLTTVPAATASVVTLVEPLTAAMIATGLLGEAMTPTEIIGTAVLLTAVAVLSSDRGPGKDRAESGHHLPSASHRQDGV
jgi:DME family drug/metabolite transporter